MELGFGLPSLRVIHFFAPPDFQILTTVVDFANPAVMAVLLSPSKHKKTATQLLHRVAVISKPS
jgi:hypothetical protein